MELVTGALKKAKVELTAEVREAMADALGSDSLKAAGLVELGSTQQVVEIVDHDGLHADARKLRERAKSAETERDRLKVALDTGDSENKALATRYKADLDKYQPLAEKLLKRAGEDWASRSASIPTETEKMSDADKAKVKQLRAAFTFPEKDKELNPDQILSNLAKLDEYTALGVFAESKPGAKPDPLPTLRTKPNGGDAEKPADMDTAFTDFYNRTDPTKPVGSPR
jgi:hypothetical protein